MWHFYKYVLKHPFRKDGHNRLNVDQHSTVTIFLDGQFFTLPNRRTFVVADKPARTG